MVALRGKEIDAFLARPDPGRPIILLYGPDAGLVRDGKPDSLLRIGEWNRVVVPAAELGLQPGATIAKVHLNQNGGIAYWDAVVLAGQADPAASEDLSRQLQQHASV